MTIISEKEKAILFNSVEKLGKKAVYYPFLDKNDLLAYRAGKRVLVESKAGIVGGVAVAYVSDIGNVSLDHIQIVDGVFNKPFHESFYDASFDHKW